MNNYRGYYEGAQGNPAYSATAWSASAGFDSGDLVYYESHNTQPLERTPSSTNSYDSYPYAGYGGRAVQSGSSRASISTNGYDNAPSPLDGSSPGSLHSRHSSNSHSTTSVYNQSQSWATTQHVPDLVRRFAGQPQYPQAVADLPSPGVQHNDGYHDRLASSPSRGDQYQCIYPGCPAEPFSRSADFARHVKYMHAPKAQLPTWFCDYKNCSRSKHGYLSSGSSQQPVPFTRKDHYKAHLRDYHMEALPKRSIKDDPLWATGKYLKEEWWRCTKCLKRNWVSTPLNYTCECGAVLEKEAQDERSRTLYSKSSSRSHRH